MDITAELGGLTLLLKLFYKLLIWYVVIGKLKIDISGGFKWEQIRICHVNNL